MTKNQTFPIVLDAATIIGGMLRIADRVQVAWGDTTSDRDAAIYAAEVLGLLAMCAPALSADRAFDHIAENAAAIHTATQNDIDTLSVAHSIAQHFGARFNH